jgi:hypothetical protein
MSNLPAILVRSANATIRDIPARNGKAAMKFVEQSVAVDKGDDFPQPYKITLDEGQQPYPPGRYYVCPSSFKPNAYGGMELGRRVVLVPLPAGAPAGK